LQSKLLWEKWIEYKLSIHWIGPNHMFKFCVYFYVEARVVHGIENPDNIDHFIGAKFILGDFWHYAWSVSSFKTQTPNRWIMSLDTYHLFNLTRLYIYMWKQSLASGPIVLVDVRFLSSQFDIFKSSGGWTLNPTKPNLWTSIKVPKIDLST